MPVSARVVMIMAAGGRLDLSKNQPVSSFSIVAIIYNPNSTGNSKEEADELAQELATRDLGVEVRLVPTERAGHAIELAYDLAKQYERPLLVSSSGDGGYNEVINGAMLATEEGATPVCAVLAAGNANDHSRTVVDQPLAELIENAEVRPIDLLKMEVRSIDDSERTYYGHSYIGLGLTPTVAVELNRSNLNRLKETLIVYKALRGLQPVEIQVGKRRLHVDSLVMANISQMAKVLTIAENAEPDDGRFEVTVFPYRKKLTLVSRLLKAMFRGIRGRSVRRYEFTAVKDMVLQVDGEVHELLAGDAVTVTSARLALATLR